MTIDCHDMREREIPLLADSEVSLSPMASIWSGMPSLWTNRAWNISLSLTPLPTELIGGRYDCYTTPAAKKKTERMMVHHMESDPLRTHIKVYSLPHKGLFLPQASCPTLRTLALLIDYHYTRQHGFLSPCRKQ
jgi:hypothetical protein